MKTLLLLLASVLLLAGCIKNNEAPSWIEVSEWTLEANPDAENETGVLTHNISDAWIYVDDKLMGVFEVPFKIPVLLSGNSTIKVYPAIRNNGIAATKKIYPFMEVYQIEANLIRNEILSINPVTRYKQSTKFWIEDFEDATYQIEEGTSSLASMERSDNPDVMDASINEGFYGKIKLDQTNSNWVASTIANNGSIEMPLPRGQEVYLEIDYHNTEHVVSGILAYGSSGMTANPHIQLNKQDPAEVKWKKIYIDIREIVSGSTQADFFEFSFESYLANGQSTAEINIDNIKAVY